MNASRASATRASTALSDSASVFCFDWAAACVALACWSPMIEMPAVAEAAVIGTQDADGLTKTKAFVVLKDGQAVTPDELKAFVKERLAPYKYPRLIEFLPELPKTATGKIQRFRLREREQRA